MKIAIHHSPSSFSDRWIKYCEENDLAYKLVSAFNSNIIAQVSDCDVFMWHHDHAHFKDVLTAKRILFALEHAGVKVFPDFKTGWHFDDKVAQKYLLDAIGAPLVPSHVFYDKQEALSWAKGTSYPKVFKLKGGAGAANVKLVRTEQEAKKLIRRAFGRGFPQFDKVSAFKERIRRFKEGKERFIGLLKGFARLFITTEFSKLQPPERGYVYFQDFIPNNNFDIRVVVIGGEKAAAEKRFVRENDFRASGSGQFSYDGIDEEVIKISFKVAKRLKLQSVAFDFIYSESNQPLIVEMCYGFGTDGISNVPGYWDKEFNWYEGKFNSQDWMVDQVINK